MASNFDYEGAKEAGYSDDEIFNHLSAATPKFDAKSAIESGYSQEEINQHLSSYKPERSPLQKGARIVGQYALGAAENALLPYEMAVAPLASKSAQNMAYRQGVGEDIERLMEQKVSGQWEQRDQEMLDDLLKQIQDPRESEKYVQTVDLSLRGLAEKATGLDLHPEGILEKAANWSGFVKDPRKWAEIAKSGLKAKDLIKAISPSGTDILRGAGAGTALQMAENGNFGPIGTMVSAIVGDIAGGGTAGIVKGAKEFITKPKATLAKVASLFTSAEKKSLQKEIIKDFRDSGIQMDLGTMTDNNLIKMTQTKLAQSGLTGKAFDDLREATTKQIKKEYNELAKTLGESKFSTAQEAGEIAKEGLKDIREAESAATRKLYENANNALREDSYVHPRRLAIKIKELEKNLKPGRVKSIEQKAVLNTLEMLKEDLFTPQGKLKMASVKDLMNNKIAIGDIINYEVQGGAKQLLKNIVNELDRAIISHGMENPTFVKNYILANKKFSNQAKTFRNKNIDKLFRGEDPAEIMNKMKNVQAIRDMKRVLSKTPVGDEIFNRLKRTKLDQMIGDNLIDSTSQQAQLGTFSKLLEKSNNRDIIKEILTPDNFKRLERLQKNAGRLAEANQKFYNASKSGANVVDAALITAGVNSIVNLLQGNPWPIVKFAAGVFSIRQLSSLLADAEFLKLAEEAILTSEKGNKNELINIFEMMRPYILQATQKTEEKENQPASFSH
jgi:hypothetical protein